MMPRESFIVATLALFCGVTSEPESVGQAMARWCAVFALSPSPVSTVGTNVIDVRGSTARVQSVPSLSGRWVPVPGASQPVELPAGLPFSIVQDGTTLSIIPESGTPVTHRLDGSETETATKSDAGIRTSTSDARWSNGKLIVKTREGFSTREIIYSLAGDGSGRLTVTETTTLLHSRLGALTVSTIGPFVRVYQRDPR
jgi:hypothetical protein